MSKPCCGNCRFFYPMVIEQRNLDGVCRRYPPVARSSHGEIFRVHPPMNVIEWCGEHQPKPEAQGD